jgi:putative ABC transport system permease protein
MVMTQGSECTHRLVGWQLLSFAWRDLRASGRYLRVFWSCLMLGVALIGAGGGLFHRVSAALLDDTRAIFGGDLEVQTRAPLGTAELAWMRAHGDVSLLIELRTMMLADGRVQLIELQSVDAAYPLYGHLELAPRMTVDEAVGYRRGLSGAAVDPVLADRLGLAIGDRVSIGNLSLEVRARIARQPDRSLNANWRGPPVLVADEALAVSGLVGPGSVLDYEYRVRIEGDPDAWGNDLARAFPETEFEVRTFRERQSRIASVLGQIASGLLLIGFSTLFVGGLGVFNSVRSYLESKLTTIATLRALGLRDRSLAAVYLIQILLLAATASFAGALAGGLLVQLGTVAAAERLPLQPGSSQLVAPLATAWLFGVLTALTFALPAIGRALSISPAALFRGDGAAPTSTPVFWWCWTLVLALVIAVLIVTVMPQPWFGVGFIGVVVGLLASLEAIVRMVRTAAQRVGDRAAVARHFPLQLAIANLYQPGAPLRVTLLSLGSALTVLVASTVVVAALLETIEETIPQRAPALVFYDVAAYQVDALRSVLERSRTLESLDLVPLVLGRMSQVNNEALRASGDTQRSRESRDEHKLTYRAGNIDQVEIARGRWWPQDYNGPPLVAFEDREADQLGIYTQRGVGTRFWFEGIFSDGALDPFIHRYVGAAYLSHAEALAIEPEIVRQLPNVVTVRTERLLREARAILARAASGLALIAGITLLASLLVLASVIASSRARQVYNATILHALGARITDIRISLALEYVLIALLTSLFAIALGSVIAMALLQWRIGIHADAAWWYGAATAFGVAAVTLGLGARTLLRALQLSPAALLRAAG